MTKTRAQTRDGGRQPAMDATLEHVASLLKHAKRARAPEATRVPTGGRLAARGHSARVVGLDARRWWIRWNRTFTYNVNVEGSSACGKKRRFNRAPGLGDEASRADQGIEDSRPRIVRGLHGARRRVAGRLVMHQAHGARTVPAGALPRMRVDSGGPQRDGYERHRPDLAEQPDRRDRGEHPAHMGHYHDTLAPVSWTCQTCGTFASANPSMRMPRRERSRFGNLPSGS